MFKTLINRKVNTSNIIQQIEHLDIDFCELILASELLNEGVYSLEVVTSLESTYNYFVTPSFFREEIGEECYEDFSYLKNSLNDVECYSVFQSKPSFLPIYTKNLTSLLHDLSLLRRGNDEIFIQLLFQKKSDRWKEKMIDQYAEYLKGNNLPSSNRLGRSIQRSIINVVSKIGKFDLEKSEIKSIEEKILDEGYRFELRIITLTNDKKTFESELVDALKEYDFFNELNFTREKKKQRFVNDYLNREFSDISKHQTISERELISLITDDKPEIEISNITETLEEIKNEVFHSPHKNIGILPIGEKLEREIDHNLITELPIALKKARAIKVDNIEIIDTDVGATIQRITFKIPKDHVYSDIKTKFEDIGSVLGTEISITQGHEPNTVSVLIPCRERDIIYLKEVLESDEFNKFASENPLPFVCGVGMHNELVVKCLTKAPHLLVVGATNSGKSVFMNSLLLTLILLRSPNDLRMILIDPKKVELAQFEGIAHVDEFIDDMEEAYDALNDLIDEMEDRYTKLAKAKVKNISGYNKQCKTKMPYIVCAIDEYNDLKLQYPKVEELIERLGQKARAAGIHLIIGTQTPNKDVISNTIKTNLPSRISFQLNNHNEYKTVFGTGIPYRNLLGRGDGVVKYIGQTEEFIRFQAPVITLDDNEEEEVFEKVKNLYEGKVIESLNLVKEESDLDVLKRIIANTGEVRFGKLREELGKGSNTVKLLMDQLVEEGWLEEPESRTKGYQLIADEDELNKWKER